MLWAKDDTAGDPGVTASESSAGLEPAKRRPLLCRDCGQVITHEDARIAIDGQHEHMRVNPAAYVYRFGCFVEAEGCAISGDATEAFTWFDGCRWQYAHCRGCRAHLGWAFTGAQNFFGLLLDRIVTQQ